LQSSTAPTRASLRSALTWHGEVVLRSLIEAAPDLGSDGQRHAIKVFEDLNGPRAASALIPMLSSADDSVRISAIDAVAALGAREALPARQAADERAKSRGDPPDSREREGLRRARTRLGGRRAVVPAVVAEQALDDPDVGQSWLPKDQPDVIEALAGARQLVLGFW
jgi:HEAT repeat protein